MKAVVIHAARDLRVEEREPETVGPGQVGVAIEAGGICGSDLHYYQDGGFGSVRVREPMILGHEIAGRVVELGAGVTGLAAGDRVAVSPSRPCGRCEFCLAGMANHCTHMRFYGSAMPMPHIQGGFREILAAEAWQCHKVPKGVSAGAAACAEPLAVTLHAVTRAGPLIGRRVLVSGCGPIGALAVLAARLHGAREIVVTDVVGAPLATGLAMGADEAIDVAATPELLAAFSAGKGHFDVQIECSGNERALRAGLEMLRPGGVLVQVGTGDDVTLPLSGIVSREIEVRGSFRFVDEFALAVELIGSGRADVGPLITGSFPVDEAVAAFELAGDRTRAMKVQLEFS